MSEATDIDFSDERTSLEDIEAAGWHDWGGSGGWYGFEKRDKTNLPIRYSIQQWVKQLVARAHRDGAAGAKREMRNALGLKG